MKTLISIGTRPEAIKMIPIVLKARENGLHCDVLFTGQHKEIVLDLFKIFDIKPKFSLDIMKEGQTLEYLTANIIMKVGDILKENTYYDYVLVHGDTTTSMAVALSCFYNSVKVCHVEAGLRTYNLFSPFPEEFNRQCISRISNINFCPTPTALDILEKENLNIYSKSYMVGNTVIDMLFRVKDKLEDDSVSLLTDFNHSLLLEDYVLITAHRRENWGSKLETIFKTIVSLATKYPKLKFVYPVHPNPKVKEPANRILGKLDNIILLEPQDYFNFTALMIRSKFIITDSGGIQEEAPAIGKKVIVLRENTERPEAVSLGLAKLVGADKSLFESAFNEFYNESLLNVASDNIESPYGDGDSALKILKIIYGNDLT